MSSALRKRVARLERTCQVDRDWRQFGDDPSDMPDWALLARLLWNLDHVPEFLGRFELSEAHRLYEAGQIEPAFGALRPLLTEVGEAERADHAAWSLPL